MPGLGLGRVHTECILYSWSVCGNPGCSAKLWTSCVYVKSGLLTQHVMWPPLGHCFVKSILQIKVSLTTSLIKRVWDSMPPLVYCLIIRA